ncbi:MAG: D-aminoacyl-tRNA deacylase [Planctomycetota bacterium]
MRALLQRVWSAAVEVEGQQVASIGRGLLVFFGVGDEDAQDADVSARILKFAEKIIRLRIFPEADSPSAGGRSMQRSVEDVDGSILLVSQFTLYADCRKGRRPSFEPAAAPDRAEELYREFAAALTELSGRAPQEGVFGAHMNVSLENDGPVTIWLENSPA